MSDKINYNDEYKKMQAEQRQRLLKQTKPSQGSNFGGGGGGDSYEPPAWKQRMEYFNPTSTPTRIRLIPEPTNGGWYSYRYKWITTPKGKRQIIANYWGDGHGDFTERDLPCCLNHFALENGNGDWLSLDEKLATTVCVLEDHYKVPKMSRANREYHVYERSLGADKHGRSLDPVEYQKYDKVFGRKLHWSLSPWAHKNFMNTLMGLSDKCANCNEGEISVYAYACPECNEVIADHREDTIDRDSEHTLRNQNVACPHCDSNVRAVQMYECVKQDGYKGDWVDGCGKAQRIDASAPLDLVIRAVPAGKGQAIEVLKFGPADNSVEVKDWMLKRFDFDKFLGKMDLEEQAKIMGVENPFDDAAQATLEEFFLTKHDEEDDDSIPF